MTICLAVLPSPGSRADVLVEPRDGEPAVSYLSDVAVVLEYTSVYDVHTPADPSAPLESQAGGFLTEQILADLADWVDPTAYHFVLLFSVQEVPGWINSGARGLPAPAKNIGLPNDLYGEPSLFPEWPVLYAAPHMNSIDFLDRPRLELPRYGSTLTAIHEMAHTWGVYWAPGSEGPREWNPNLPLAWLASSSAHWTWPGNASSPSVWLDPGLPGILYSGPTSDRFNAFDLYAMGLMGYDEARGYSYHLGDLQGGRHVLQVDDLLRSLSLLGGAFFEGDGRRVPDTDPAMGDLRTLLVVVKGADEDLTFSQAQLLLQLARDLPADWSTATWGRSSMTVQVTPAPCGGAHPTIVGSDEADTLVGTSGRDVIAGLGGDDVILGRGGADVLCGGPGADTLRGGDGADRLYGGEGPDNLWGEAGNDRLWGQAGRDTLVPGPGSDIVGGGGGADTVGYPTAPAGLIIDLAAQTVTGGDADTLSKIENAVGSPWPDLIRGSSLANVLWGRGGNDTLQGADGDDRLLGGLGKDTADGGRGTDTCRAERERHCER